MTNTQKNDRILEILDKAVAYSGGGGMAIAAVAVMIQTGVNVIAEAIGARRVDLSEVITRLENQTGSTDATIKANREQLAVLKAQGL